MTSVDVRLRHIGRRQRGVAPFVITLAAVALAALLSWAMWDTYMAAPWTRDGTVRSYVVTMAPEVAGRVVGLPVADNQYVHKGDLLMEIEPTDYQIALANAEAAVRREGAIAANAEVQAKRRLELKGLTVSIDEQQLYSSKAVAAEAAYQQAQANLRQARVNLDRTQIRSPVDGWVTNLLAQLGDYAHVGQNLISVVDAHSFWVDGYFEETSLSSIHPDDPAEIKLMGYSETVRGHVVSIARGINVPNAQANAQGLATVNPIFTWVRLAQRIPVRVKIDDVPKSVALSAGMTATVQIDAPAQRRPDAAVTQRMDGIIRRIPRRLAALLELMGDTATPTERRQ
jgi:multidrug resistance efflux pump